MSSIFDNLDRPILPELKTYLAEAYRADFCVGYFNLRGWQQLDREVEGFEGGDGKACRLLVGMFRLPQDEHRRSVAVGLGDTEIDQGQAAKLLISMAQEFRQQLTYGVPTVQDEAALKRLQQQLRDQKLIVKLYLRHSLHSKLYLIHRHDRAAPAIGYVGSSNLTFSGLKKQGELNVEITDKDDTQKLGEWFEDRWNDRFCRDISDSLAEVIDESWAGRSLSPYYVYLKFAYHLSREARAGLSQYSAPANFGLLSFQAAAVQIAARLVNQRNGVVIGDVVGLGKTLVGTALAHLCEEEYGISVLIICPKNLESMWQGYVDRYGLRGKVVPVSQVETVLPNVPARFRLVLIDESHNLRNKDGKRYRAIRDYIEESGSRCILLTATPYNKSYLDLSAQLELFVKADADLGIKPEAYLRKLGGERRFQRQHPNCPVRSLRAFEMSSEAEDWQQLMDLFLIRRTRSFIQQYYTQNDGDRAYLEFPDGTRSYFPTRQPRTVRFAWDSAAGDPYAQMYSDRVVDLINSLRLPRYGLGQYSHWSEESSPHAAGKSGKQSRTSAKTKGKQKSQTQAKNQAKNQAHPSLQLLTSEEQTIIDNLSHAGQRLMGFCRTNLFKRLESSGAAFVQSIERHILRNYVFLHAIAEGLPLPIGSQDATWLDEQSDDDTDNVAAINEYEAEEEETEDETGRDTSEATRETSRSAVSRERFQARAAAVYSLYRDRYFRRFKWIRSDLFKPELAEHLRDDSIALMGVLDLATDWDQGQDAKLRALAELLHQPHGDDKVLIFTQFADTAKYLANSLAACGIDRLAVVTGQTSNPTELVRRFSPRSQKYTCDPADELRVLIATDVLSEGQNLQDCAVIVNYDLPWAIIRLIQRAGRVDRMGQQAETIQCYSFLPADGIEQIINLRGRLARRLRENQEVVGTDEAFFEDEDQQRVLLDNLYNERSGILDDLEDLDGEVDLTSEALEIWLKAIEANPSLKATIEKLPDVVYATRAHTPSPSEPEGVLMYIRTPEGTDSLAWVDRDGNSVTQSQAKILRMARCALDTPPLERHPSHHELVSKGLELIAKQRQSSSGSLGGKRSVSSRVYDRLTAYVERVRETMPLLAEAREWDELNQAIEQIHNYPLKQKAIECLNRDLKLGVSDEKLAEVVRFLREQEALCVIHEDGRRDGMQIICSMGLFQAKIL